MTSCHPKITFLQQLDTNDLPDAFVHDIEHWKTRSGTVKVNLAIDRLPTFTADPEFDPEIHGGAIQLLDDGDQLEEAFQDARFGQAARRPFSDTEIPSVVDTTLTPEGSNVHTVSMFTQWVPADWADDEDDHAAELDAYADRLIERFDLIAPGFKDSVLARQVIGPKQMQQEWDLIGGNIFHGELTVDQLFHMRPAVGYADYRSPIAGLYQASSATHAGGGVTGLPGHHAVREILQDKKKRSKRSEGRESTDMTANRYDAIVIGGGHNGLITAAYLAKHGARTVVLESRHKTGGAADTMSPWEESPDIKVTTLSYVMSLMPPTIQKDLQLERFGYKVYPQGMGYLPVPDGGSIIQHDDEEKTRESIRQFSKKDADAYFEFEAWIGRIADIMGPLLMETPPNLGSKKAEGHQGRRPARLDAAQGDRPADGGRHHAPVHDERHRPAGPLVRVAGAEGLHGGQRHHRHVGRSRRARHGVRADAPLGGRHRRRADRLMGLSRGRHGRGERGVRSRRRGSSAPRSA